MWDWILNNGLPRTMSDYTNPTRLALFCQSPVTKQNEVLENVKFWPFLTTFYYFFLSLIH